ncbi:gamma-glutamyltransferase [Telmatospirillum siberiense]|uniref:Gamma-glutamyltransferase n=1 Tax=Telmatospirillum siberiense TaxID=382514 RepID=A0A2N3PWQ1_9PROT|nr:gamma-glutamyltransferase [Telmatospirillum siberiense]PKU24842.1 gamma-glutamyltransferase [Telmatospirillum siberiense]
MRFIDKVETPLKAQGIRHGARRQRAVPALVICFLLAACGGPPKPVGVVGHVKGFAGMVAADEPNAVLVGRDIISAGGTPADAAVAMSFVLSVTLPSRASLGAGGACLVYDQSKNTVEALDFNAPPPRRIPAGADRPSAVPALPRGLFALSAKYGHLRWEELVTPAERLARQGFPMPRVLSSQLSTVAAPLLANPEMRRVFADANGNALAEGQPFVQMDLGATLTRLRTQSVGDFYAGAWAREIVQSVNSVGGSLSEDEMRDFLPQWKDAVAVAYGDDIAYFSPSPAAGGLLEAQWWSHLVRDGAYDGVGTEVRPHLVAETLARGLADRQKWLGAGGQVQGAPDELTGKGHLAEIMAGYSESGHQPLSGEPPMMAITGTGLVVMDQSGSAVACTLGLNNSFGIGRVIPNTGVLLAAAGWVGGRGPFDMGPMLAINANSHEFRYASAAGGGPSAPAALMETALSAVVDGHPLVEAVAAKRFYATPAPDGVFIEPESPDAKGLEARGHQLEETPLPARVNAIQCGSGSPSRSRCAVVSDPRGSGLALVAGSE